MSSHARIWITCGLVVSLGAAAALAVDASEPAPGGVAAVVPAPDGRAGAGGDSGAAAPHAGSPAPDTGYMAPADTLPGVAGWMEWLAALEASAAGPADPTRPQAGLLYPLDSNPAAGTAAQPYRHLAIARAVGQLEATADPKTEPKRGRGHADQAEATRAGSPLLALANARNYLNLSEYDKALEWYAQAAARDAGGDFRRETGREKLAAAICARDTVAAGLAVAATLQATDLVGREGEVVLAFRWLLTRHDAAGLGWLVQRTEAPEITADARVGFWRAYALSTLDRRPECLAQLDTLLQQGDGGRRLNERERCWVLTATADLLLLQGSTLTAEALYTRLAGSAVPALRQWGRLQAAGLAFVGHRYGEAGAGYRQICQDEKQGLWGPHACAMADIAARLDRLMSEGERYGADANFRR